MDNSLNQSEKGFLAEWRRWACLLLSVLGLGLTWPAQAEPNEQRGQLGQAQGRDTFSFSALALAEQESAHSSPTNSSPRPKLNRTTSPRNVTKPILPAAEAPLKTMATSP